LASGLVLAGWSNLETLDHALNLLSVILFLMGRSPVLYRHEN